MCCKKPRDQNEVKISKFMQRWGKDSKGISKGFVSASLLYCVGAMAIVGSMESGLSGNHQTLFELDSSYSVILAVSSLPVFGARRSVFCPWS